MTQARSPAIAGFLTSLETAFAAADAGADVRRAATEIFARAARPMPAAARAPSPRSPSRLPVCHLFEAALRPARAAGGALTDLANALTALEPQLAWTVRTAGGPHASAGFAEAHANAYVLGRPGCEPRDDVMVGISLMAPQTRYPDHDHAPEEIYLVLTAGEFQHGASGWFAPGVGGTLYNRPGIRHAMRSHDAPFLALWCLRA